jgi:hypothetical protein
MYDFLLDSYGTMYGVIEVIENGFEIIRLDGEEDNLTGTIDKSGLDLLIEKDTFKKVN